MLARTRSLFTPPPAHFVLLDPNCGHNHSQNMATAAAAIEYLSLPLFLSSFMPPILFGGSTPMRPGSNHGTKERGTAGPPQGKERRGLRARREKEEITLYCILVNWRGSKRGEGREKRLAQQHQAAFPKKERPHDLLTSFPLSHPEK